MTVYMLLLAGFLVGYWTRRPAAVGVKRVLLRMLRSSADQMRELEAELDDAHRRANREYHGRVSAERRLAVATAVNAEESRN